MQNKIRIGSRGSDLALWQAHHVKNQLESVGCEVSIEIIKTQGDQIQHLSFDKMEGKGFFTKEIESALLKGSIDLAVHSHKDLETTNPEGLIVAAVSEREDPRDILVVRKPSFRSDRPFGLAPNALVGTSSARRRSQLLRLMPELQVADLRGNVPTRIEKLRNQQYDAVILAMAGVSRLELDLSDFEVHAFDPTVFVPCPAQGVLGLQVREKDTETRAIVEKLNDAAVQKKITVERKILNLLDGGCQLPLGAFCPNEEEVFVSFAKELKGVASVHRFDFPKSVEEIQEIVTCIND
jgi:hydroxymethylbilane synthase